jgi:hypothetical protein
VSVEPVTATLPVAPLSVHSGVPPPAGGWVGQPLSGVAGGDSAAVMAGAAAWEDVLGADAGLSELHAARARTAATAQAAKPTEEHVREKFTVVTLPLRLAGGPPMSQCTTRPRPPGVAETAAGFRGQGRS